MDITEIAKQHAIEQIAPELEQTYYTFTEHDLREFASRIRSSALFDASWIVESNAHDWEESIRQIDKEANAK